MPEALVVVDSGHQIAAANELAMEMFGWSWQELQGRPIEVLVPSGDRATHVSQREAYMQAPEARPMGRDRRLYAQRKDGSRFLAEIALGPVQQGSETWVIAVVRDVTERAETERAFQETQHRLRRMM